MKPILPLLAAAGLLAAIAMAQQSTPKATVPTDRSGGGTSSAYAVGGIAVDVTAKTIDEARRTAWTMAMRQAWPQLWSRLTGREEAEAPRLGDGQIDAMVAGIESQGERFSDTRYIARLGVVFDRSRVVQRLGGDINLLQSPPMLLLPLLIDGGTGNLFQRRNIWAESWQRWRGNVTPIDYVLPTGGPADNLWLTMWQTNRHERTGWRQIITRFDTVNVLIAEARLTRSWPGGPVNAVFVARHGPDGLEVARFALRAPSEAALPQMLEDGVRRIDAAYAAALRAGVLQSDPDLAVEIAPILDAEPMIGMALPDDAVVKVAVITPDAASLAEAERVLGGISGDIAVRQLALGGTSRIDVAMPGGEPALIVALARAGWLLERVGDDLVLRRGKVPPPAAVPTPPAT